MFCVLHLRVIKKVRINIRAVSYQQESLFIYVKIIIHNFFFCNRNHFNSVVSFSICTIAILYLPCTCNIIRQGKMSKSEYKQLVYILYYNDTKFLWLHYICMLMSVLVRTALCFYCYNLILCSYCCTTVVYNLIFVSSLLEFGSYSLTPHQVRQQQRTLRDQTRQNTQQQSCLQTMSFIHIKRYLNNKPRTMLLLGYIDKICY